MLAYGFAILRGVRVPQRRWGCPLVLPDLPRAGFANPGLNLLNPVGVAGPAILPKMSKLECTP